MSSRLDNKSHTSHPLPMSPSDHNSAMEQEPLKRQGSGRRSLRSLRCQSVVITEKEKTLLIKQTDKKVTSQEGKVASNGFVRSMCKFYSDIIGGDRAERKRSLLDRSASFSAVKDGVSLESISEKGSSEQCLSSPVSSRSGSFRLNRSRSWRGSRLETYNETDTPKRNSPTGQSVRSQDSGFSDSGENIHPDIDGSYESQSSCPTSGSEEDSHKSFVTQINIEDSEHRKQNQDDFLHGLPMSEKFPQNVHTSSSLRTGTTPVAREKVTGSLDNIVSLQEGFKIKLETQTRSLFNQGCESNVDHFQSTTNNNPQNVGLLLRPKSRPVSHVSQARLSTCLENETTLPLSPSNAQCPRFSTPVRASFRRRPQTMILMDETHTPVKRESRTRLKEIKSRRRWSTNIDQDQSKLSPLSVNTTANIKNSGSQFCRNNLNADACYEFRNPDGRNPNLSPSMTAMGLISPVQQKIISPDSKNISPVKNISVPDSSFNVDGTGTRLMIESFIAGSAGQAAAASRSINTIFPNESVLAGLQSDTIIEHESSLNSGAPIQYCNKSGLLEQGQNVVIANTSVSNR